VVARSDVVLVFPRGHEQINGSDVAQRLP